MRAAARIPGLIGGAATAVVAGLILGARPVAAQLCPPAVDPCEVTGTINLQNDQSFDLGGRALVVRTGGSVRVSPGGLTIRARTVVVEPGASLRAPGQGGVGGRVTLVTSGDIRIEGGQAGQGLIEVSAGSVAGDITLTATGDVHVDGVLAAVGGNRESFGGNVTIEARSIALGGTGGVDARAGNLGDGGFVRFTASADIMLDAPIRASAGDEGGSIRLTAAGDIVTTPRGAMEVDAAGDFGNGGEVLLDAGGSISAAGSITGKAAGSPSEGGGLGADVALLAGGNVTLSGGIDASGAAPDGEGGVVDVVAGGNVRQTGAVSAAGGGREACGGEVDFVGDDVRMEGPIDVSGGDCGAGFVVGTGVALSAALGEVNADGDNGPGGGIFLGALLVDVGGNLHASGSGGGLIDLHGCELFLSGQAHLTTLGAFGENILKANTRMLISTAVVIRAGRANLVFWGAEEPDLTGRDILPVPLPPVQEELPPCPGTPPPTTTTTSTVTTTTSVSTSSRTSTSTSVVTTSLPSTSTTSTRPPGATTTTTMPPRPCTPGLPEVCDDGDPCTEDICPAGTCENVSPVDLEVVMCGLTKIDNALERAAVDDLGGRKAQRAYRRQVAKVNRLVQLANALTGNRSRQKVKRANNRLAAFITQVERRASRDKIAPELAAELLRLARTAAAQIAPFLTAGSR